MVQYCHPGRSVIEMTMKPRTPEQAYGPALRKACEELPSRTPQKIAVRAAVTYKDGTFRVPFFGNPYEVDWPEGTIRRAGSDARVDIAIHILVLHYLLTADGTPLAAQWIAFRNLPGGLGYDGAFQGRANQRLARAFGTRQPAFEAAARSVGGEVLIFGDASFSFRVFPRLWMAAVLHLADDEFPASANVLFDGAASHYLPTEDLAVLGGMLASLLCKAGDKH
jgi:hypothetical protein